MATTYSMDSEKNVGNVVSGEEQNARWLNCDEKLHCQGNEILWKEGI